MSRTRATPDWCALPCHPSPAACASGFSITAAVSTNTFTSSPDVADQPSRQRFQALLDDVVIIVALRVSRDRPAGAPREQRKRIFVGSVIDAEHDDGADAGTTAAADRSGVRDWPRASPCRHARRHREIREDVFRRSRARRDRSRRCNRKAERRCSSRASARFRSAGESFGGRVQKSRST